MKCQNCEAFIQANATVCPNCGAGVAAPSSGGGNRILKKVGATKVQFFFSIAVAVIFLALFVLCLNNYITEKSKLDSSWFVSQQQSSLVSMFGVCAAFCFVATIEGVLTALVMHKMSICVCENTVYGMGTKCGGILSDPFEFSYDEIIGVKTGFRNAVIIEARSKTCKCQVADSKAVCQMIQGRMRANRY